MAKGGTCLSPHYDGQCSTNTCSPPGAGFTTLWPEPTNVGTRINTLVRQSRGCDYVNCPCLVKPSPGTRCPLAPEKDAR